MRYLFGIDDIAAYAGKTNLLLALTVGCLLIVGIMATVRRCSREETAREMQEIAGSVCFQRIASLPQCEAFLRERHEVCSARYPRVAHTSPGGEVRFDQSEYNLCILLSPKEVSRMKPAIFAAQVQEIRQIRPRTPKP